MTDSSGADTRGREAQTPAQLPAAGWRDILKRTAGEIKNDNIPIIAAGVAFYFWLALIPAAIAAVMIYGLVSDPATIRDQITSMLSNLSQQAQEVVAQPILDAATVSGLSVGVALSLLGVIWSASAGMNGLIKGLGIAYDEPDERGFVKTRGLALVLTLGALVFLTLAIFLIGVIPAMLRAVGLGSVAELAINIVRWPLLALVVIAALAVVYKVGPDRDDPQVRWASWGAAVATILWLIGSAGFSFYVSNFGSYNETYGALAGVIILNLWLFLTAFIVLLGAELNAEMEAQTRRDTTRGEPQPMGSRDAVKADHVAEGP